jgi:hypothetical protein
VSRARLPLAALVLLGVAVAGSPALLRRPADAPGDRAAATPERVRDAIDAAAAYLHRHQQDGRFVYRIRMDGSTPGPRYNVVRHAGALYGLAQHFELSGSDASRQAVLEGARELRRRYLHPVRGVPGAMAVFSLAPEEVEGSRYAKLGGSALGLVALLAARDLDPEAVPLDELRGLGEFILFMQEANGRFRAKYHEQAGFAHDFESVYYPGEAILALARLHRADPDPRWLSAALDAAAFLVRSRQGATRLPNDHWLMIATADLLPLLDAVDDPPISREALLAHAIALGHTMLEEQRRAARELDAPGSFLPEGTSTPTATRLEGLAALHSVLSERHEPLRRQIRTAIERGIAFLLRCQVRGGRADGGVLRALRPLPGAPPDFNRRQQEIRIDYNQHALSALIGWLRVEGTS